MEAPVHSMHTLFLQLGLPADEAAIRHFIHTHSPLPPGTLLHDAAFWTPAQRALLQSGLCVDADWAVVIDALNASLMA